MSKFFIEETEITICEISQNIDKSFKISEDKYITKINQTLEFSASIFSYDDKLMLLIKRDDNIKSQILNVYSFDPTTNKEIYLYSLSGNSNIFIRRTGKNSFYIITIDLENEYGSVIFCTLGEDDIYNTSVMNFSRLINIQTHQNALLINCYEQIVQNSKIIRLYHIALYDFSGKIKKTILDIKVKGLVEYRSEIINNYILVKNEKSKTIKKVKL